MLFRVVCMLAQITSPKAKAIQSRTINVEIEPILKNLRERIPGFKQMLIDNYLKASLNLK